MKKIINLIFGFILILALAGCKENSFDVDMANDIPSTELAVIESESVEQEETTQEESEEADAEEFYSICTSFSKTEVEDFAKQVKQLILEKDWGNLAELVQYPITINDVIYEKEEEFAKGEFAVLMNEEFYREIENETCEEMFCNWQGIMLNNGEVWIGEVLDKDVGKGELKVIAINI